MLLAQSITVNMGGRYLLNNVSLSLGQGEVLAVLGPNGAGKSTLLKALSGDLSCQLSRVSLQGKRLLHWRASELAMHRAVMPQSVQLTFPFTVAEVLETGIVHPMPAVARRAHIRRMLALFDVEHLLERNYLTLSGGEQQRVQLARVVGQLEAVPVSGERFLFLDECTSSLDLTHQHQVFTVMRSLARERGIGILAVLHDLNLAAQYADSLLLLRKGECVAQGDVDEVLCAEQLSDVYQFPIAVMRHPNGWPMVIPA